jgi:hypothetical protein
MRCRRRGALVHAAAWPLAQAHIVQCGKRPRRLACYTCEDAGSLSFRARCVCSCIGAGHWRCCASEIMVRGNDELSSCNRTDQTMTCRSQGDI